MIHLTLPFPTSKSEVEALALKAGVTAPLKGHVSLHIAVYSDAHALDLDAAYGEILGGIAGVALEDDAAVRRIVLELLPLAEDGVERAMVRVEAMEPSAEADR